MNTVAAAISPVRLHFTLWRALSKRWKLWTRSLTASARMILTNAAR